MLATAAVREAKDGAAFIARGGDDLPHLRSKLLSGKREARLAALGVIAGVHRPDGVVGDLGGGSLELVDVRGDEIGIGVTLPLGGLALAGYRAITRSRRPQKIVRDALEGEPILRRPCRPHLLRDRRHLARARPAAHGQTGYPLHVMHGYAMPPTEALEFARLVAVSIPTRSPMSRDGREARRPLLPYGALVLEQAIEIGKPKRVVVSALGVREGLLYEMLDDEERRKDPLIVAASDLNVLRSRSPRHGEELIDWTDRFMTSTGIEENAEEQRLRHAACLLADIGWRAHPDYRGEQSLNIIAHAAFVGIDHPGRAFLALAVFYRHAGIVTTSQVAAPARARDDAASRPRPHPRRRDARRLSRFGVDAGRAAARARSSRRASSCCASRASSSRSLVSGSSTACASSAS